MSKKKHPHKGKNATPEELAVQLAAKKRTRRETAFVGMMLACLAFIAYSRVLYNDFVYYDDELYVTENAAVQSGLTAESLYYAMTGVCASNWHPLTMLSHIIDCTLYGLLPMGHHLSSLLLHSANTFLLFLVLRRMTGALWPSAAVALLFGVHPLHVVSVAHVAQRKDVLSTLFWLLTMHSYARYAETRSKSSYVLSLVFYALGLLAKPMLVTLPVVLLLLDFWPLRRFTEEMSRGTNALREGWILVREKVPFLGLALAVSVVTLAVQHASGSVASLDTRPLLLRIENALVSYVLYLAKMFWPAGLAPYYPYPQSIAAWKVLGAIVLLAAVTVLVLLARKKYPYLAVGWLWYLIALVPVIGIIQVGAQALADRYTYVPLIGIFLAAAWGLDELVRAKPRWRIPTLAVSGGVFAALMCASWVYAGVWRSPRTLWEHAIAVTKDNPVANYHLGVVQAEEGELEDAERSFKEALRIMPEFQEAQHNLAVVCAMFGDRYSKEGRLEDAIAKYSQGAAMEPEESGHQSLLGRAYWLKKDYPQAAKHYAEAVRLSPNRPDARLDLAMAHEALGHYEDALRELEELRRLQPGMKLTELAIERVKKRMSDSVAAPLPSAGPQATPSP